jgi:hypothetical protein
MKNSNTSGAKLAKIGAKWMPVMARRRGGVFRQMARDVAGTLEAMPHLNLTKPIRLI